MKSKVFVTCVLLSAVICVASAAVAQGLPATHPDHPGKCWSEQYKRVYVPGQEATAPDSCTGLFCKEDLGLTYATCGVKATDKGPCKLVPDLSLDYPNCCKYECS